MVLKRNRAGSADDPILKTARLLALNKEKMDELKLEEARLRCSLEKLMKLGTELKFTTGNRMYELTFKKEPNRESAKEEKIFKSVPLASFLAIVKASVGRLESVLGKKDAAKFIILGEEKKQLRLYDKGEVNE
jgi:hypothetical protein